jgi:hypothetical protein
VDSETARQFLIEQTAEATPDGFLVRLRDNQPPVPGQVTSILVALKTLGDTLKGARNFDREIALALFLIAHESRQLFESGLQQSTNCPPLLHEDLNRIAKAVRGIFAGD